MQYLMFSNAWNTAEAAWTSWVAIQLTNFVPEFRPQFVPEILFWKGHLYELEFLTLFYSTFACIVRAETRAQTGAETRAQNFVNWIATLAPKSARVYWIATYQLVDDDVKVERIEFKKAVSAAAQWLRAPQRIYP